MARMIFEHRCSNLDCNELNEHFIERDHDCAICPHCESVDNRVVSTPKLGYLMMGADPSLPTAAAKWDKMHRQAAGHAR